MWARNCPKILHKFRFPLNWGIYENLRRGTGGFTSLPNEGVQRIFSQKFRRLQESLNTRTWVLKARTLPQDHLLYLHIYCRLLVLLYFYFVDRFVSWWVKSCFHVTTQYFCQPCWIQWRMCCTAQGLFVNTQCLWNLEKRWQCVHLVAMHSASTASWYIMELNHADSGLVSTVFINLWDLIFLQIYPSCFSSLQCSAVHSPAISCYNIRVVQSWRQGGRRDVKNAVFELLSL